METDDPDRSVEAPGRTAEQGRTEAIEGSLLLLVPGMMLVATGLYLRWAASSLGPSRWPVWEVLVAMGGIALVGGMLSFFTEDDLGGFARTIGRPEPAGIRRGTVGPPAPRSPPSIAPVPAPPGPSPEAAGADRIAPVPATVRPPFGEPPRAVRRSAPVDAMLREIDDVDELLAESRERFRRGHSSGRAAKRTVPPTNG